MSLEEIFGEPIHVYSDAQAVDDGEIVDLTPLRVVFRNRPVNRMTRRLYADLSEFVIAFKDGPVLDLHNGQSPIAIPVPAEEGDREWAKALAHMLRTKLRYATDTARGDDAPGEWFAIPGGDEPIRVILNETGGWTVLYLADY